jgi:hypothetical protein
MSFPQPSLPALYPGEDPLGVKPIQRITSFILDRLLLTDLITSRLLLQKLARQPRTTTSLRGELRRQLITARVPQLLVLGLVSRDRLSEDLPRDPVIVNVGVTARARRQLCAINRDHPRLHQSRSRAQLQYRTEQLTQPLLMTTDKPGDGGVIGHPVTGDHEIRDVLTAVTLNPPRGPLVRRVRIQHQAHAIIDGSYAARPCPSAR